MKITKHTKSLVLIDQIISVLEKETEPLDTEFFDTVILNFRDPRYSSEDGGFHPVEISLTATGDLQYITDFSYVGAGEMSELEKELDFDFSLALFQQYGHDYVITEGAELFKIWQENFCSYYQSGMYEVEITTL